MNVTANHGKLNRRSLLLGASLATTFAAKAEAKSGVSRLYDEWRVARAYEGCVAEAMGRVPANAEDAFEQAHFIPAINIREDVERRLMGAPSETGRDLAMKVVVLTSTSPDIVIHEDLSTLIRVDAERMMGVA